MRDENVRLFCFCLALAAIALIAAAEFFGDTNSKYAISPMLLLAALGFGNPDWVRRLVDHAAFRWELHNESFYLATMTVLVGLSLWAIVWTILLANDLVTEMPFGKVGWVASFAMSATMSFLFFPWETLRRVYLYCERRAKRYGTLPRVWFKAVNTGATGAVIAVYFVSMLVNTPIYSDVFVLAIVIGTLVAFFAMPNPDWQAGTERLGRRIEARPWERDIKDQAWPAVSAPVNQRISTEVQAIRAAQGRADAIYSADLGTLRTQLSQVLAQNQRLAAALESVQDRLDRLEANLPGQIEKNIEAFSRKPEPKFRLVSNIETFTQVVAERLPKGKVSDPKSGSDGSAES
jgi:hypothetical protein